MFAPLQISGQLKVTVHGIQLEHESSAVACRHFPAHIPTIVLQNYCRKSIQKHGLTTDTIVAAVTDNAFNFSKAFQGFNITVISEEQDR